jgi:hypothetical protein
MFRRISVISLLAAASVAGGGMTAGLAAAFGTTAVPAPGVWQRPVPVPGLAKLDTGRNSGVDVLSCTAPGACTGGGSYVDGSGHNQTFVVGEVKGVWGTALEVSGSGALNAGGNLVPTAVSCASPGNCAIGGSYTDGSGNIQAWVADETGGVWGEARELPGTGTLNTGGNAMINAISCAAPGECAAGGNYSVAGTNPPATDAFVASEVHGSWSSAAAVPGASPAATLTSISCGAAGDCVGGGESAGIPYLVTETSGTWGSAQSVTGTGPTDSVTAVSCEKSGCDAVIQADEDEGDGFGVTETDGSWGSAWGAAQPLPVPVTIPSGDVGTLKPDTLSCTSPGNCTAAGWYAIFTSTIQSVDQEGFIAEETDGTWAAPQTVPSLAALDSDGTGSVLSVSCPAPGYCEAVAQYSGGIQAETGAILSEVDGTWGKVKPLSSTSTQTLSSTVSCGAVSYCSAGATTSGDGQHYEALTIDETPVLATKTTESLSAARAIYGREQTEKISVTVSAPLGVVSGTVQVRSGTRTACTITLAGGEGSCTLPATAMGPGRRTVIAAYRGGLGFAASSSATRSFAVARAASRTSLRLSVHTARYGHEQAEKLTATVAPQYGGTPTGAVLITAGRLRICVITPKHGSGSCRLTARSLRAGVYQLRATYQGSADFKGSAAVTKQITITS